MLSLHNELINNLYFSNGSDKHEKRSVLLFLKGQLLGQLINLRKEYVSLSTSKNQISELQEKKIIKEVIEAFVDSYGNYLEHYMNNLYQLIKLVQLTKLTDENEKPFYVDIIKAQLTPYELMLIFYFSIVQLNTYPDFNPLIKGYKFFEHLDMKVLADAVHWEFRER
jgi:hypothetical protein